MTHNQKEPQYIDEAEALVGDFFTAPDLENTLHFDGIQALDTKHIEERQGIYTGALRVLARERRALRRQRSGSSDEAASWNEAFVDGLTAQKLATIRTRQKNGLGDLTLRLARLNGKMPPLQDVEDIMSGLYEHQKPYMREICAFLASPPTKIIAPYLHSETKKYAVRGAIVEAPTGLGKSAFMGRTVLAARIGTPLPNGTRNYRALVTSPSKLINEQLAGLVGDDTFRRFAPSGIDVVYYQGEQKRPPDPKADVVITTIEQFVKNTKDGRFCGQEFDLLLIDEAHQITEPQFQQAFLSQWRLYRAGGQSSPIPAIGFTARTAYNKDKDAAKLLPTIIKHQSLSHYMHKNVLSAGQFYTVIAEPVFSTENNEAVDKESIAQNFEAVRGDAVLQTAYDMALPLLREGRRGIIFCEAGDGSYRARQLAEKIDGEALEDGQTVRAKALYVRDPKSQQASMQAVQEFNEGKLDLLTTVGVGQQGLNADFNFVGICGNIHSLQKLTQELGRGLRKSKEFPVTVFFHIVAGYLGRGAMTATFGDVFDTDISQGETIGPKSASGKVSRVRRDHARPFQTQNFTEPIQLLLKKVITHSSQEIESIMNSRVPIPEDYISFEELYPAVEENIDRAAAKRRLDGAGYAWRGRQEARPDGTQWLHRYYEPAARSYFTENPVPARATAEMKSAQDTEVFLGISSSFLENLRRRMEAETDIRLVCRLNKRGAASMHYDTDALEWLAAEVAATPVQEAGDITAKAMAAQLGVGQLVVSNYIEKSPNIKSTYKRRADGKGFGWFFSAEQAAVIRAEFEATPWATDEWSLIKIAEAVGLVTKSITRHLTPDEQAAICVRRAHLKGGQTRAVDHLPADIAKAVIARVQERNIGMPAHMIPYAIVVSLTNAPVKSIPKFAQDESDTLYCGKNYPLRFVSWAAFKGIIQKYGWKKETYNIDFDNLPQSADDSSIERAIKARAVQLQFMTAEYMGNPDGIID